jgi:hypothetical protein
MLDGAVLPTSSADIFPNFTIKNYIAMTIFIASLSASILILIDPIRWFTIMQLS